MGITLERLVLVRWFFNAQNRYKNFTICSLMHKNPLSCVLCMSNMGAQYKNIYNLKFSIIVYFVGMTRLNFTQYLFVYNFISTVLLL